jgi:hypothetical protein
MEESQHDAEESEASSDDTAEEMDEDEEEEWEEEEDDNDNDDDSDSDGSAWENGYRADTLVFAFHNVSSDEDSEVERDEYP